MGIRPGFVLSPRKSGYSPVDTDKIVQMWAVGVRPGDLSGAPPHSTQTAQTLPRRTGHPAGSPPGWNDPDSG